MQPTGITNTQPPPPHPHPPSRCKYLQTQTSISLITPTNAAPTLFPLAKLPPAPSLLPTLPETGLLLHYGFPVSLLQGDRSLIKIVNEDLIFHFKRATEAAGVSRTETDC